MPPLRKNRGIHVIAHLVINRLAENKIVFKTTFVSQVQEMVRFEIMEYTYKPTATSYVKVCRLRSHVGIYPMIPTFSIE